jgi:sirohydrochlorin ferrochelatase
MDLERAATIASHYASVTSAMATRLENVRGTGDLARGLEAQAGGRKITSAKWRKRRSAPLAATADVHLAVSDLSAGLHVQRVAPVVHEVQNGGGSLLWTMWRLAADRTLDCGGKVIARGAVSLNPRARRARRERGRVHRPTTLRFFDDARPDLRVVLRCIGAA